MVQIALKEQKSIARRWNQWIPWATHHIHAIGGTTDQLLTIIEKQHSSRVITCLAVGLNWGTIRRRKLDDPTLPDTLFQRNLHDAVVSGHRGRKLGVRRTKEQKCQQLLNVL